MCSVVCVQQAYIHTYYLTYLGTYQNGAKKEKPGINEWQILWRLLITRGVCYCPHHASFGGPACWVGRWPDD